MRAPLAVRIKDGFTDRHVTKYVEGLRFRKTAPGGHADASCRLTARASLFPDLGPADAFTVYDERTGRTIFDGKTTNPGTQTGRAGQGFDLSALGSMSLASDQRERLIYLDQAQDWEQDTLRPQVASATAQPTIYPEDAGSLAGVPCVLNQFNPGQPLTTGSQVGIRYAAFEGSPMVLGGFIGVYDGGVSDANYHIEWCGHGVSSAIVNMALSHVAIPIGATRDIDFAGRDYTSLTYRLVRSSGGPTNIALDNLWTGFGAIYIRGQLVDRYGADRPMSTTQHTVAGSPDTAYILSSEVAEDLLGRILTFCDPATSVVETTAEELDQLAYQDPVTAAEVLDDLLQHEADFLWEFLEANADGLYRFNFRAWPTEPRYVLPASMPLEQPGGDVDLCNRITVNWVDIQGNSQVTIVESVVEALGTRIRDAEPITLPKGRGSAANAELIGQQVLATKAAAARAAKAVVDRPILDRDQGCLVQPWEIEPGYVVHAMATGEDLRLTEMEYDDDAGTAALTLGEPVLTIEQRIARLGRAAA